MSEVELLNTIKSYEEKVNQLLLAINERDAQIGGLNDRLAESNENFRKLQSSFDELNVRFKEINSKRGSMDSYIIRKKRAKRNDGDAMDDDHDGGQLRNDGDDNGAQASWSEICANGESNILNHRRSDFVVAQKTPAIVAAVNKDNKHAVFKRLMRDVGNNKFMIRDTVRDRITIIPNDKDIHCKIVKSLDEQMIEFHTFKTKSEINHAFIIRGLPEWITSDEIIDGMKQANIEIVSIKKFDTHYVRQNTTIAMPVLWKIVCEPGITLKELKDIRGFCNCIVKFETMNKRDVTQCHRCQRYFHTAGSCHYHYRCVKCTDNHPIGQCTKNKAMPPKCVNCNGNHTANNYNECSYFIENIQPKIEKRNGNKQKTKTADFTIQRPMTQQSTAKKSTLSNYNMQSSTQHENEMPISAETGQMMSTRTKGNDNEWTTVSRGKKFKNNNSDVFNMLIDMQKQINSLLNIYGSQ